LCAAREFKKVSETDGGRFTPLIFLACGRADAVTGRPHLIPERTLAASAA